MTDNHDAHLLALVHSLVERIEGLELEVKSLKLLTQDVSEDTMVAIAAAVAAYLGYRSRPRQAHFTQSRNWQSTTRRLQHAHAPLYLR